MYIHDLHELHAHTPPEHVDYNVLREVRDELETIQKVGTGAFLTVVHMLCPGDRPHGLYSVHANNISLILQLLYDNNN